jgi:DNA-binding NtrC family response regulator
MRVLVVDDVKLITDSFVRALKKYGLDAHGVYDATSAIAWMQREAPDVVLTGLNLGEDGDGFDVIDAACRCEPRPYVVMFTGMGSPELAQEAQRRGAQAFFTKPIGIEPLLKCIDDAEAFRPRPSPGLNRAHPR